MQRRRTPGLAPLVIGLALAAAPAPVTAQDLGSKAQPLEIDKDMVSQFKIQDLPLDAEMVERHVGLTGVVAPDESRLVRITTVAPGRIREIHVFPGDHVERLQTLALLDSPELARQKGAYLIARAQAELARKMLSIEQQWAKLEVDARRPLEQARTEMFQARNALQVARAHLEVMSRRFESQQELYQHGITSKQAYDQAKADVDKARSQIAKAESDYQLIQRKLSREDKAYDEKIILKRELQRAEAELEQAEIELEAARTNLAIYGIKPLSSAAELEQEYITKNPVVTPTAGTVLARNVRVGDVVQPQQHLFEIADLEVVWFQGNLYEHEAAQVKAGQDIRVKVQAFPEDSFAGKVMRVSPLVDERTRTVPCIGYLPNDAHILRPGMFGKGEILVEAAKPRLMLPRTAVQELDGETVVFVKIGEDAEVARYEARPVSLGHEFRELKKVEIRSGLTAGESVVEAGAFSLVSELSKRRGAAE